MIRPKTTFLLLLWCLSSTACLIEKPIKEVKESSWKIKERELNRFIDFYAEQGWFSGTVGIKRGNEILFTKAVGLASHREEIPNTLRTQFRIDSLTKQFTDVLLLMLEEEEQLSLADSVEKYLPGLIPDGEKITIHHLMTHTSGLGNTIVDNPTYLNNPAKIWKLNELIDLFKDQSKGAAPGEKFIYSNDGFILLTHLIEVVTKRSYAEALKHFVLDPAELKNTRVVLGDQFDQSMARPHSYKNGDYLRPTEGQFRHHSSMCGFICLYSNVFDQLNWDKKIQKILSSRSEKKLFTPHVAAYGLHYSYGFFIEERHNQRLFFVNGNSWGYKSFVGHYRRDDLSVVALSNFDITPTKTISDALIDLYLNKVKLETLIRELSPLKEPDPEDIKKILGTYKSDKDEFEVANFEGIVHIKRPDIHYAEEPIRIDQTEASNSIWRGQAGSPIDLPGFNLKFISRDNRVIAVKYHNGVYFNGIYCKVGSDCSGLK